MLSRFIARKAFGYANFVVFAINNRKRALALLVAVDTWWLRPPCRSEFRIPPARRPEPPIATNT